MAGTPQSHSANRNGNGAEFISDPTTLFGQNQRRTKVVTISDPEENPPRKVIIRAMSAGERRKFLSRAQIVDAKTGDSKPDTIWYTSGNRNRVMLALCCARYDGTPLFPEAWQAAVRLLDDPNASNSGLADLDNIDPAAEVLLIEAADEVSLITTGSIDRLIKGPLAPKTENSTDSPQPSTSPIPS